MEKLKIAIFEGYLDHFDDDLNLEKMVNEFSEKHEVVDVDVKPSRMKRFMAIIKYIEEE